jgi:2-dehydropantoate 2-reductase
VLASLSPGGKTSMQQDVEARRPSEAEMFGSTILELARKHGMAAPVNRMLFEKILAIESTY